MTCARMLMHWQLPRRAKGERACPVADRAPATSGRLTRPGAIRVSNGRTRSHCVLRLRGHAPPTAGPANSPISHEPEPISILSHALFVQEGSGDSQRASDTFVTIGNSGVVLEK